MTITAVFYLNTAGYAQTQYTAYVIANWMWKISGLLFNSCFLVLYTIPQLSYVLLPDQIHYVSWACCFLGYGIIKCCARKSVNFRNDKTLYLVE